MIEYNLNGQLHRTDNTGVILHHSNNTVEVTEYYTINERHREGYSTVVLYCCDGSVVWEEYYLNGTRISSGSPLKPSEESELKIPVKYPSSFSQKNR